MAESAVTLLLEQVKEVSIEYKDLISSAENEFLLLINELGALKAFLKDVALAKKQENMFRELESQVLEVVYDVENTIDKCLTKAMEALAKSNRSIFIIRRGRLSSYNLAKEIKSLRQDKVLPMLDDVKIRFSVMQIADGSESRENSRIQFNGVKPKSQHRVVGFQDEQEKIIDYLMESKEELDVISIIGVPGLGKTTLTRKIYESEGIDYHFPIRIWVHVSPNFNSRDILLQIMRKFTPSQDTSNLNQDELLHTVRACLEKEKFLLVVDDVWSVEAWMEIKEMLPYKNGKAKVLVTSRDERVGRQCSVYRRPYHLRFLTMDESWELLEYEIFGNLDECPPELRGIGNLVAMKCDGVPLSIVVAGGILTSSTIATAREWEMVAENLSSSLHKDNWGDRITDLVAMSYNRLPDELRQCFVFLGVFPEGYEIPAEMLCWLWISEGFIVPRNGKSLEESAEQNLNDLIGRRLLQVEKLNHMGKVKTCRVQDMIRAFCMLKSKEGNLFHVIRKSNHTGAFDNFELQKSRRLCLSSDLSKFLAEEPEGLRIRSFLCFYKEPIELRSDYISAIPDGFPNLRILESKSIKFDQFPAKCTKLIHLRYLTLHIVHLTVLPEAITQLWNLQALVVKTKSRSITMRANMWRMIRLRYLKTKAAIVLDSGWEGGAGKNLHTLKTLSPESCTKALFQRAINLKTLWISGELDSADFESNLLEKLSYLENLKLVNGETYGPAYRLPGCIRFPPNLKRLTLTNTFLSWQQISMLAEIKTLEALKLKDNAFVGISWNVGPLNFPNLQLLLMVNTDLVLWDTSPDNFPSLRCLVVKKCENLREIPECLGIHIEKLEIDRVRYSVVESAKKIAEIRAKFSTAKFAVPFTLIIGPSCFSNYSSFNATSI